MARHFPLLWKRFIPDSVVWLASLIKTLRPDCIHSLGMQNYSYTLLKSYHLTEKKHFPPWIYSSKGSDIYYYAQFPEHKSQITATLKYCNYYVSDCRRDIKLATRYGFKGELLGIFPCMGSYPVDRIQHLRSYGPVSSRKIISVKGLQHRVGRALNAIKSLYLLKADLNNGEIIYVFITPHGLG